MQYTTTKSEELVYDLARSRGEMSAYLDLVRKCILRQVFPDENFNPDGSISPYDPTLRREGRLYPTQAFTMVGELRLRTVERLSLEVVNRQVPGDLVECGVWRGGCAMMMKAVLRERNADRHRLVWLFDSFEGAPEPTWEQDAGDTHHRYDHIFAVGEEEVRANFRTLDLLDQRVVFRKGWFSDTVPAASDLKEIAILRLDGDMYESTKVCLDHLYDRVSDGGYVLVDDYYILDGAKNAVEDFRREREIVSPIQASDWNGCYWRVDARNQPRRAPA